MNFYWSHAIPLQKLSNERSYKFSWILTLFSANVAKLPSLNGFLSITFILLNILSTDETDVPLFLYHARFVN